MTSNVIHPLQSLVRAVSRRARRIVLIHAVGWVAVVSIAVAVLAGLLDWLLRYDDYGVRLISTVAVLAAIVLVVARRLAPALRWKCTDVQAARRIERKFPSLGDRLSSAIEFVAQDETEPTAGSVDLRRSVVTGVIDDVERHDLASVVDPAPAYRAAAAASVCGLLLLAIWAAAPQSASLAARRILLPLNEESWPQRHQLTVIDPPGKIAAGDEFEVTVIDERGRLPDDVEIQWQPEGAEEMETASMTMLNEQMVHRRTNVRRSFRFRAVGGDDYQMPWHHVQVAEPPQIAELDIRLHPPEYTGWPVTSSGRHIRALSGTTVSFSGKVTKPLKSAWLLVDPISDDDTQSSEPEAPAGRQIINIPLAEDRQSFALAANAEQPWAIETSGSYRFQLIDHEGLEGGGDKSWEIRAQPDEAPQVVLEEPAETLFVTPDASVDLQATVTDDLQVAKIELLWLRSDRTGEGEQSVTLFEGPPAVELDAPAHGSATAHVVKVENAWELSSLPKLTPGVTLAYHLAALDYKPQAGRSGSRKITIVSVEQFEDRLSSQQADMLSRLAEALKTQREARSLTKGVEIQLGEAGKLQPDDVDQLNVARSRQERVEQELSEETDKGVAALVKDLLQSVENNRVDSPEVRRRLTDVLEVVQAIVDRSLPDIHQSLTTAAKTAEEMIGGKASGSISAAAQRSLARAGQNQQDVIEKLERLVGDFSQWDSYRRFARDVSQLRRDQQRLQQETRDLAARTLGRDFRELSDQEKADAGKLAQRQQELARRFEKLQGQMQQMSRKLADEEPLASQTLADGVDAAQRKEVANQLRQAAQQIEENQVSRAGNLQESALDGLEEVMDALSNRREHELQRRIQKLTEAQGDLARQRRELGQLEKETQQAIDDPDEEARQRRLEQLKRQREDLAERAERLSRRLERLQAEEAAQSLNQAQQQMQAEAQDQSRDAKQSMEQSQQQLEDAIAQAKQQLLQEQAARMEQWVAGLKARQTTVWEETTRLSKLKDEQGELTPGQSASVRQLALEQQQLQDESRKLAERLVDADTFVFALEGAQRQMARAARLLTRGEIDDETKTAEQAAIDRLVWLLEAVKQEDSQPKPANDQQDQQPQPSPKQPDSPPQLVSQLKLLKLLQDEINRRTLELELSRSEDGKLSDEKKAELVELSKEQGELAGLLLNLSQAAANPEDDPENLPELPAEQPSEKRLNERTNRLLDFDVPTDEP